jgi:hypothetical protein
MSAALNWMPWFVSDDAIPPINIILEAFRFLKKKNLSSSEIRIFTCTRCAYTAYTAATALIKTVPTMPTSGMKLYPPPPRLAIWRRRGVSMKYPKPKVWMTKALDRLCSRKYALSDGMWPPGGSTFGIPSVKRKRDVGQLGVGGHWSCNIPVGDLAPRMRFIPVLRPCQRLVPAVTARLLILSSTLLLLSSSMKIRSVMT